MRSPLLLAVGLVCVLVLACSAVQAAEGAGQVRQPLGIERTAFEYPAYAYQEPEAAVPTPAAMAPYAAPAADGVPTEAPPLPEADPAPEVEPPSDLSPTPGSGGCSSCGGCSSRCFGSGCGCGCSQGKPWTLPQPCLLQRCGIKVGGWVQQGITFNGNNPVDGFNGPVATNDLDTQYQLNQLWLFVDKPADTGGCGVAWGGHIDMLYGSDYRFGINYGLEDRINSYSQDYGMVIPQMYAEFAVNRLSVKVGHFAGILDYEVIPAPFNPFYSHSYSYGYTVPQLVTGVMADYKLNDCLSVQSGFHRGWMMFEDLNHHLDYMGGVKWQAPQNKASLAYAVSIGPQDPVLGDQNRFASSLVAQLQCTQRLRYVLVHNLGVENNVAQLGGRDAEWYGLNQYFLYKVNDCLSANVRVEWLRDDDGTRVAGPGSVLPVRTWSGFGFAGNFYETTIGLNWRPNANWLVRPECRWDWYAGPANINGDLPFNDGNSDHQFTFGCDAVLTY